VSSESHSYHMAAKVLLSKRLKLHQKDQVLPVLFFNHYFQSTIYYSSFSAQLSYFNFHLTPHPFTTKSKMKISLAFFLLATQASATYIYTLDTFFFCSIDEITLERSRPEALCCDAFRYMGQAPFPGGPNSEGMTLGDKPMIADNCKMPHVFPLLT
jgi:hypothetical protein